MKVYENFSQKGAIATVTGFFTKKESEEEDKKYSGVWIDGIEYLDTKKLAEWLPWKVWNIRIYVRTGKIKGVKIKGKWFVARQELYNFLSGK